MLDPTTPIVRANIPVVGSIQALKIQGNSMYMSISNTLQLFDLSNPARPLLRGSLPLRGYPADIVVDKNMAYITYNVAADLSLGGLDIVDVGNPANDKSAGICCS